MIEVIVRNPKDEMVSWLLENIGRPSKLDNLTTWTTYMIYQDTRVIIFAKAEDATAFKLKFSL